MPDMTSPAGRSACVVSTDVVDSTRVHTLLGDDAMAALWARHDAAARELIRRSGGIEIGRADGLLALFDDPAHALAFAHGYHAALAALQPPLTARVGAHHGPVTLRENPAADRELGAVPLEVDGLTLPIAVRAMAVAGGGQTVLTRALVDAAGDAAAAASRSLGHWRLKGVDVPIELLTVADAPTAGQPPQESPRAYRVLQRAGLWVAARELPHNLPAERDPFFGRQAPLAAVQARLDEGARLLTLLGPGGVGKTRLALQHARGWQGDFPGGTWFCDLSAATSASGVHHAVAQALGVPAGGADAAAALAAAIGARGPCLLVLDNFEQVAREASATVGRWLEACAEARFVVTSREVLGLPGEQVFAVAPLERAEAVAMFQDRAAAARGDAAAGDDEAAVAELVDRLDRLPLAIELAASRARLMTAAQMRERIGQRFQLLAARGGRIDRQATMRATLDWSWELLDATERAVLAQLTVFEGGFEVADAEAVLRLPPGVTAWVPDVLQALLEKSWLRTLDGRRLGLLRTVQDYAAERLDADAREAAQARHAGHYAGLDEAQATRGRGVELDNIVAACRRAAAAGREDAVPLLMHAWAVLHRTGPFEAGAALAAEVRAALPAGSPAWGRTHRVQGAAETLLGRRDAARGHYRQAEEALRAPGCEAWRSEVLALMAGLEVTDGRLSEADCLLDEAEALVPSTRPDGFTHDVAAARFTAASVRARVHIARDDWEAAGRSFEAGLAVALAARQRRWEAGVRGNLGSVAQALGKLDEARIQWQVALALAEELGDRQWAGNTRCNLGLLLVHLGKHVAAREVLEEALAMARSLGHRLLELTTLCNLGIVAEVQQHYGEAVTLLTSSAEIARTQKVHGLEGLARAYLALALAGAEAEAKALEQLQVAADLSNRARESSTSVLVALLTHLTHQRLGLEVDANASDAATREAQRGTGGLEARYLLARISGAGPVFRGREGVKDR